VSNSGCGLSAGSTETSGPDGQQPGRVSEEQNTESQKQKVRPPRDVLSPSCGAAH